MVLVASVVDFSCLCSDRGNRLRSDEIPGAFPGLGDRGRLQPVKFADGHGDAAIDRGPECPDIGVGEENAVVGADPFRRRADIGGDHGQAPGHRLENDRRHPFGEARAKENVA